MSDAKPLVWLPFEPGQLGAPPDSLRYELFDGSRRDLPASVAEVEFYVPPYDMSRDDSQVLARMSSLRVVQSQSAGVDSLRPHIRDGVQLCNARGVHDASTAELAITLILASLRGIPGFVHAQDAGRWETLPRPALADRRVLIIGYGSIGAALERRLAGFDVEVVRVARTARADGVHGFDELDALVPDADVVVLVVPLTEQTRGMVDAAFLARMKQGALLVNIARGPVVDTEALITALESGRITAALDVTDPEPLPADHPLWRAPNVLISPHIGGASSAMRPRADRLIREQLERFAAGEPLANVMTGAY